MSKELYVTSTPHETKLAVVEDDQLVEVFFERENEYTLAGSIYKGKVTRVLPGMQSAFVDIGLERDAFLYVTDFLEEVEDDDAETAKAGPADGDRGERPERSERSERSERGRDRGRHRRLERGRPQQAAPTPAEGSFTIEHDSTQGTDEGAEFSSPAEPTEGGVTAGSGGDEGPQTSGRDQEQERSGGRRWRGRRGRRRRGVPESKFAQPDGVTPEAGEAPEPVALHETGEEPEEMDSESQAHFLGGADEAAPEVSASSPEPAASEVRTPSRREEQPRESRGDEGREGRRPERSERTERVERPRPAIVLPGESLAKFGRKVEEEKPKAGVTAEGQTRLPRPSTEYTAPTGFAAAGLLAGESLAKYRNRPAEPVREAPPQRRPQEQAPVLAAPPLASPDTEETEAPIATPVPVQSSEAAAVETAEPHRESPAETGFRPGHGVVEEEEIEDEEHEFAPFSEQLEEGEFEELEEETLEDQRENEMIAAGEGLAEAFALSRAEDSTDTYLSEEAAADEEEDDEEDEEEGEESAESEAEAEVYADDADGGEEALDPEDPNYSGRAEMRSGAGTAGFQQRSERTERSDRSERGPDRQRRDRGRRGRPMRRGGPRRNIPRGPMPQIGELLKEGQEILVQIAKEPMAKKGARITSHIALPGRFLVFMPTVNHTGVSRKIGSDEERQRLKRILLSEKGQSSGGFIVRTAAAGASEDDLRADIRFLINLWGEIKQRAESSKAPALIYHDLNLVERILRDQVTSNFSQIWVDTEPEYERILRFASRFQPSLVKRVKLYTKDTPLFEQFSITDEINKALKSKVWLKSGGYIVINQTEALVAIDINTGKYVGKTGRLEDTIVKTNLDAIKEIVRQIRLRDLGGIIIIDFIDMDERKNRQKVMQALEAELKHDRSPSKVLQFNDFGLVAITRKRVKQSLERTLSTPCPYCTGTGMTKSVATVCNEIYVEMRKMNRHLEGSQIMLRVNPEVGKALKENQGRWLVEMEELTGKSIIVKSDPAQHQEQFDIQ